MRGNGKTELREEVHGGMGSKRNREGMYGRGMDKEMGRDRKCTGKEGMLEGRGRMGGYGRTCTGQ